MGRKNQVVQCTCAKKFYLLPLFIVLMNEGKCYCTEEYTMYMKTTYCMTEEVIAKLAEAEKKTGRDRMDLLDWAMRILIHDFKKLRKKWDGTIEYQKRTDEEGNPIKKHRVKVKLLKFDNLLMQDLRRFCFMSISLLIAIAVETYLDEVVAYYCAKYYEDVADNYLIGNWSLREKYTETGTCITIWYGVPPNYMEEYFG